jgi:hypothetical protein
MRCEGNPEGTTCGNHKECDVGLACLSGNAFPFTTVCTLLRFNGD